MNKIKICGNTNPEDAKLSAELGSDYLGIIFAESKRKISVDTAKRVMGGVPGFDNFVGVFMNQPKQEVQTIAETLRLKYLQFHGDEPSLYCRSFADKGYKIIKTFRVKDAMSLKRIDEYNVFAFLLDTFSKEEGGGTGKTFDWNLISERPFVHDRLFLAGGLNPENVGEAVLKIHPFAVDVASGVEKEPGKKDPEKLRRFIQAVKQAGNAHAQKPSVRS